MKECDIFRVVKTYYDPSYIFSGGPDPQPQDLRPWLVLTFSWVWKAALL